MGGVCSHCSAGHPLQLNAQGTDDLLALDIVIDGLRWQRAQVIADKLRNLISVYSAELQPADFAWVEPAQAPG